MTNSTHLSHIKITAISLVAVCAHGVFGGELGKWSFADGAKDWIAVNQASVSDFSRRAGTKSLLINQWQDSEQDSCWLSPPLKSPGKPVKVCFWTADNYLVQPDLSYSAAIGLAPCDESGKAGNPGAWEQIPWDEGRREQWWGPLTNNGLLWKYHEATLQPPQGVFRVKFFWPKAMARGECHLADMRVLETEQPQQPQAAVKEDKTVVTHTLEISTPAEGNLFFADDPLRFEILLFNSKGAGLDTLAKPELTYDITDYEKSHVASGVIPFDKAAPCAVAKTDPKIDRSKNLRQSIVITDPAAKAPGRELFLHMELRDGGKLVAEDTITYGVVAPRAIAQKDYDKCLFAYFEGESAACVDSESKHERQSVREKMGVSFIHDWDYTGWKKAQPQFPGPINIEPAPDYPKLIYCPNLEQMRGRKPGHPWGDISSMAPAGATLDDPANPGCKTFDIDGYVAYIAARVKAQRNKISLVVPSGLERPIDARTIELQRKAYAAIKKECPELPVGMMLFGIFNNPSSDVDLFLKEKLYECADFVDGHMYQPSVDWTEWKRLRSAVKQKGKDVYLLSTEFSRVGGKDQLERSRAMVASHLDAWSQGMRWITYFNVKTDKLRNPVLRGEVPGDGFQWMQVVDRPRVSDAIKGNKPVDTVMPLLQCLTYHNLVREFELSEFKTVFNPGPATIAYVFARNGKTVCAFWLDKPVLPETLAVNGDIPFTAQDLYGKTNRLEPSQAALLTSTKNPTVIVFEREVPLLYDAKTAINVIRSVEGGMAPPTIPRGTSKLGLAIPAVFGKQFTAKVTAAVDEKWPKATEWTVQVAPGQTARIELPIEVPKEVPSGSYTLALSVRDGERLVGLMKAPMSVMEILTIEMTGLPMTPKRNPAVIVTVRSLADVPMKGEVAIDDIYFGEGPSPMPMSQRYSVPRAWRGGHPLRSPALTGQHLLKLSHDRQAEGRTAEPC